VAAIYSCLALLVKALVLGGGTAPGNGVLGNAPPASNVELTGGESEVVVFGGGTPPGNGELLEPPPGLTYNLLLADLRQWPSVVVLLPETASFQNLLQYQTWNL
jgi:hypothetical protein